MERVKKGYINIASIWGESRLGVYSVGFSSFEELKNTLHKIELVLKGAEVIEMPSEEEFYKVAPSTDKLGGYSLENSRQVRGFQDCWDWIKSKIVK